MMPTLAPSASSQIVRIGLPPTFTSFVRYEAAFRSCVLRQAQDEGDRSLDRARTRYRLTLSLSKGAGCPCSDLLLLQDAAGDRIELLQHRRVARLGRGDERRIERV